MIDGMAQIEGAHSTWSMFPLHSHIPDHLQSGREHV